MKNLVICCAITALLFSCKTDTGHTTGIKPKETADTTGPATINNNWKITKGALGPIKTGKRISEYNEMLKNFETVAVDAFNYKYDGGGVAYEYRKNGNILFTLMPARDTDSIIAIMVIDKKFSSVNGISTAITVGHLTPALNIYEDYLGGGEFIADTINRLNFIFDTTDKNKIAEYPDVDTKGIVKRTDAQPDWITIN